MSNTTPGMVCAHHHLYSTLARGMPAPRVTPRDFLGILNQVWWRLDAALDLEMIRWSAMLGAAEALMSGTTCIVDHHESPNAIEGSLEVIQSACAEVGVRVITTYGVTDRWQDDGTLISDASLPSAMTTAAQRGLDEIRRHAKNGNRTMVGLHAAFTCSAETIEAAAELANELGVGVHIHVAEGDADMNAASRLRPHASDDWLLAHCVHLKENLFGRRVHNPRSNMNNGVGYAHPAAWSAKTLLGTDGIGADMFDEARVAYALLRAEDTTASPDTVNEWLHNAQEIFPESKTDLVEWSYDHMESAWHLAYTTGIHPLEVTVDDQKVLANGAPTRIDIHEIRAKAAEQSKRLHERLAA